MLETTTASVEALVRELDILIRARYPLISVTTFEESRFRRLMEAHFRGDFRCRVRDSVCRHGS